MLAKEGDIVKGIKLDSSLGEKIATTDFLGKNVILYFYPKDNTPGCSLEAKLFEDYKDDFEELNTVILGVSKDSIKSHMKFRDKLNISFALLSDEQKELCDYYGVMKLKKFMGKEYHGVERSTFIIDKEGRLIKEYRNVKVKNHIEDVMSFINEIENRVKN